MSTPDLIEHDDIGLLRALPGLLRRSATLAAMPQTNKDRQEALRARRLMLGQTEVRGIYLPPELHAALKAEARKLLKKHDAAAKILQPHPKEKAL